MQDPRALLAALHRAAVEGAAPFERTRDATRRWLETYRTVRADADPTHVHLVAVGKASRAMAAGGAEAVRAAGAVLAGGVVVSAHRGGPHDQPGIAEAHGARLPPALAVHVGDHPVPGPASLAAADAIDDAVRAVTEGDIAIVLLSGGATALTAAPVAALAQAIGDVDQAQARIANLADTLLESGLAIHEMNAIRRRVLRWGAGRLAVALAARGAVAIPVFAISDVIGDDPSVIGSGPCTADPLDDADFLALLDAHDLRRRLERDMAAFLGMLGQGQPPRVPPRDHPAFARVDYRYIARNRDAVAALASAARAAGIDDVRIDELPLQGEAAELGDHLARHALADAHRSPSDRPRLLALGGEPVVNLRAVYERAWEETAEQDEARDASPMIRADDDEPMRGGRMQLLALAAALALESAAAAGDRAASRIWLLAAGTDGRDGPTDAAGAIVDAAVPALARRAGRSPERDLATGRSWFPLDAAHALLRTGPTGTNVMDVVAVLILPAAPR
jgi:hydroxypyruvate reductase